jgi:hypothetical protein
MDKLDGSNVHNNGDEVEDEDWNDCNLNVRDVDIVEVRYWMLDQSVVISRSAHFRESW